MRKNKISIIIPIYNSKLYLQKCLNSVIHQSLDSIEIICINDGSTDGSLDILKGYADKHDNIKLISQENKGASVARNVGLKEATGKYIMFVDSDDTIDKITCELCYNKAESCNADIVLFHYNNVYKNKILPVKLFHDMTQDKTRISNINSIIQSGFTCKLYKKQYLISNDIFFPLGITISEDAVFLLKVYSHKPIITFLDKYLYFYTNNINSISHKYYQLNIDAYLYWIKTREYNSLSDDEKLHSVDFLSLLLIGSWFHLPLFNKYFKENRRLLNEYLHRYDEFKNYKKLIGYKRIKYRYIYLILKRIKDYYIKWR